MRSLIIAMTILFSVSAAHAETFPVITDKTVLSECTDCHMAFPPQTLTKAVWTKIMGDLSNHFGEDASLDAASTAIILDYHLKNANDVSKVRASMKWKTTPPASRVLLASRFIRKHKGCEAAFAHEKVKLASNCLACHGDMQKTGSTKENLRFLPASIRASCGED
ncbi:MAG: hypothetical protein JKY92_09995 [Magnetovibrio sp.]|nr:hypothetical protein [Magnetovibrio sp.]